MDVVIVYFVNESLRDQFVAGRVPLTIEAHGQVAQRYGISTINLAREVAQQIAAGTLTWKQFGGTHPAPFGNAICARMIDELFGRAGQHPLSAGATPEPHKLPQPLDPLNYSLGHFIEPGRAVVKQDWQLRVPDWKQLPGNCRERFRGLPLLCAETVGAELSLEFTGTTIGAYLLAGPDAGTLEARIDNCPATEVNLYHQFSAGLHYPRTVIFGTDLPPGQHVLTLRMDDKTASKGHAARILQFVAN
jgi:hypothetical protein